MGTRDDHRWPIDRSLPLHRAFWAELRIRPVATSMVTASVWCGVWALVLGENASRAFTIIGGQGFGALIAHLMGAMLVIGGIMAMAGGLRLGSIVELFGLMLISGGAFIYAAGVLIGLGTNGLIAGGFAAGLAVGSFLRVMLLSAAAKKLFNDDH